GLERTGIGRGREAGGAGEHALEMARRITDSVGEIGQCGRFSGFLDRPDGAKHGLLVTRDIVGQAALAWSEPGLARFGAAGEEAHVGAARMAGSAGWAAIDAGREHAGDEAPVERAV